MHPSIQMTDDEVDAFLDANKTMRVATNGPDGYPHNVPVGYQYIDGTVFFPSDEESQKTANLRADPRVCCIVDEGEAGDDYESLKGVMIRGDAEIFDEEEHATVTHDELLRGIFGGEIRDKEYYERVDRVVVEVTAKNVVAWDFTKVN